MRRLLFDIETSPNLGFFWQTGREIDIDTDSIVQERAIICICWKWAKDKRVFTLTWDKGKDKKMIKKFVKVMEQADEIVAQNGDRFDIKWLRTRCIYHRIPMSPRVISIDTLKETRKLFKFNSNRLDYVGQYLGVGQKGKTGGFDTWKDIVLHNDPVAMRRMIKYCKQDVVLLERVWDVINPYVAAKLHYGKYSNECPECGKPRLRKVKERLLSSGVRRYEMKCTVCGKYCTITKNKLKMKIL